SKSAFICVYLRFVFNRWCTLFHDLCLHISAEAKDMEHGLRGCTRIRFTVFRVRSIRRKKSEIYE
ncbi:MAG: hypothetical protein MUO43_12435, partial [Desulfobacterales bacterium]|nr:hypothetical protein [Desulfobacterales bacterium]